MQALEINTKDAIKHNISFGKSESRSINIFNVESYLINNEDLKSAFGNDHDLAKRHFVEYVFNESRTF